MDDFSFSEEERTDTEDSLDIKPPQAAVILHKSSSSRRREERGDRREGKERKSRHYDREERHRNKHRHRRHGMKSVERSERSEDPKRDRERVNRLERLEPNSREGESSRHGRKDRGVGDRILDNLRTRLPDQRHERRDDPRDIREYKSRERRELRLDERRGNHTVFEDGRERREMKIEEGRHMMIEDQYSEPEMTERPERAKRHKRNHKHERARNREKMKRERDHREKQLRQAMETIQNNDPEPMIIDDGQQQKDSKEMTVLRKVSSLETERVLARRKEVSRLELKRGKKRTHSPEPDNAPSVVELSDESHSVQSDEQSKSPKSQRRSSGECNSGNERSFDRHSLNSSIFSEEDKDDSARGSREDSNEGSDFDNASPLSMDRLAKSDNSDGDSPGRVESNGVKQEDEEEKKEITPELPPYLPAIQGCRSVEQFQCLNRIEEGTYGVVYRARDKRTEEIVALKRLKMEKEKEGFPITSLREINTLLKAQQPNIVTVREIVVGSNMDKIFIVMDYVEHDLKSLMDTMKQKKQVFISGEIKCLMQQLLRAVAHLHDNWILHRDLKTSNLLLSHRGILKVGDFGLAREYGSPLRQYTPVVVTRWYRAPELLLNAKAYSTPIDMWSVGCIFAELLRMEALFPGESDTDQINRIFKELGTPSEKIWPGYSELPGVKNIVFAHYPVNNLKQRFHMCLSDQGMELLNKLLTYDPAQRLTAKDALEQGYFTEAPLPIDPDMFPTWPAKS